MNGNFRRQACFRKLLYSLLLTAGILLLPLAGCTPSVPPPPQSYAAPPDAAAESGRPLVFMSATQLAETIRLGLYSSEEVVTAHLRHIHKYNPALNAIVTIDEEGALRRAREADRALGLGEYWGPLHGVPVTVKDHFAVQHMRTTNGFLPLSGQITDFDATPVKRLKDAGAIIIGKTNMPPLAMDVQTDNPIFGRTNNPWNLSLTPGGSTGGGAAAVAAGLSPLELGSDIGGSIRIPSHFCGIYGFKPTENTVSNYGNFPGMHDPKDPRQPVRHMASIGPVARSVEDLALCFSLIAGPDGLDGLVKTVGVSRREVKSLEDLKIGWAEQFSGLAVSADTARVVSALADRLKDSGCRMEHLDGTSVDLQEAWELWGQMMDLEIGVARSGATRLAMYLFGAPYRSTSPLMQMVFPASYDAYLATVGRKDRMTAEMDALLLKYDVLICPVATGPAIVHHPPDDVKMGYALYKRPLEVDGRKVNYWLALAGYTTPFNVTGHPVVVIPAGRSSEGLPVGVQIIGKRGEDMALLQVAQMIDQAAGDYQPPPGY